MGHVIAAGKTSSQLTEAEVAQAWAAQLPDGVSLVPLLMEAPAPDVLRSDLPSSLEQKVSGVTKRGRLKKEEETE